MKSEQQFNKTSTRNQPLMRLHHAAIITQNMMENIRFYSDILGLKEAFCLKRDDGTLSTVYLIISPGQYLELIDGRTAKQKRFRFLNRLRSVFHRLSYHGKISHLCMVTDDIRHAYDTILVSGGPIDSKIERGKSQCLRFWTHDPDGNQIEIIETPPESMQAQADERFANQR